MTEPALDIRRRPMQARSAETFDHILDTATLVLEDVGWDGFSTNLLAQRAGIGIQTLYRYFPNKLSVVATLARRLIEEWDSWFEDPQVLLAGVSGIALFVDRLRNQPGGVAVRQAMMASPALRTLDREDNLRLARRFASALLDRDPDIEFDEAVVTILVATESALAVIDLTYDLPRAQAQRMIELCIEMQTEFLSSRYPILGEEAS